MSGETISVDAMREEASGLVGSRCDLRVELMASGAYAVLLAVGRRQVVRLGVEAERVHPVVLELAGELAATQAAGGEGGFAGDGWWRSVPLATARQARVWVRYVLLNRPAYTDSQCDRFIASLDWPKRDELLRRAVEGKSAEGF